MSSLGYAETLKKATRELKMIFIGIQFLCVLRQDALAEFCVAVSDSISTYIMGGSTN